MKTVRITYKFTILMVMMSLTLFGSCASPKVPFNPEIGVCTNLNNAEMLSGLGYQFIEESVSGFLMPLRSDEEFNEKLEQAQRLSIPVKACNGFIPGNLKSVGPNAVHEEILRYVETALRRAQMAGVQYIVFGSGASRSIPDGFSYDHAVAQFIVLGKAIGPIAAKYDVVIVLEPLNKREVNFINSLAEGAQIVEAIDHPNFLLLADIYHMLMEDEGPEQIIEFGHLIRHVHVAEKQDRAIPGTHNEDLSAYYQALRSINYRGDISIEGRWQEMESQAPVGLVTIKEQL